MSVPGLNILSMATMLIAKQSFQYLAFLDRDTNEIGQDVTTYADPVTLTGSVQPVPRELFERFGLDLQSNYINVFVSRAVIDVTRDVSGDRIIYAGNTYQCLSKTAWDVVDGWDQVMCVEVPTC